MRYRMQTVWRAPQFRWGLKAGVAGLLIYLLLAKVDLAVTLSTLANLDIFLFLLALTTYLAIQFLTGYQRLFGLQAINIYHSVGYLFKVNLIANFYSFVLPGGIAGSGVIWYKITRSKGNVLEVGIFLILFRLIDLTIASIFGVLGIYFDPFISLPKVWISAAIVLTVCTIFLLIDTRTQSNSILYRYGVLFYRSSTFPRTVAEYFVTAWQTIHALQSLPLGIVIIIFLFSFVIHVVGIVSLQLLALAVGISLPFMIVVWIRSLLVILQLLPLSFGGLGIREASLVFLLGHYGIPGSQAMGLSLAIFGILTILSITGGFLEIWDWLHPTKHRLENIDLPPESETVKASPLHGVRVHLP